MHLGHYRDTYVRIDGGWRFATRRFHSIYRGAMDPGTVKPLVGGATCRTERRTDERQELRGRHPVRAGRRRRGRAARQAGRVHVHLEQQRGPPGRRDHELRLPRRPLLAHRERAARPHRRGAPRPAGQHRHQLARLPDQDPQVTDVQGPLRRPRGRGGQGLVLSRSSPRRCGPATRPPQAAFVATSTRRAGSSSRSCPRAASASTAPRCGRTPRTPPAASTDAARGPSVPPRTDAVAAFRRRRPPGCRRSRCPRAGGG